MSWTVPVHVTTGDLATAATENLMLDNLNELRAGGLAISGQAANRIPYATGAGQLATSANLTFDGNHLAIAPTGRIYLDGTGDTYLTESSANNIKVFTGGAVAADFFSTGMAVQPASKVYLDGGVNTYLQEISADDIAVVAGGVAGLHVRATDIFIPAANEFYLDGGSNTYLVESSADVMDLVVGTVTQIRATTTGVTVAGMGTLTGGLAGTVIAPTISANQNNWAPTGHAGALVVLVSSTDVAYDITGLQGGVEGRVIIIRNGNGSSTITLKGESGSSSAANRFAGGDLPIVAKAGAVYVYTASRWQVIVS